MKNLYEDRGDGTVAIVLPRLDGSIEYAIISASKLARADEYFGPIDWTPQDDSAYQAEKQNQFYLDRLDSLYSGGRGSKHQSRAIKLDRSQIIACGLAKYIDDIRFVFIPLTKSKWTVINESDAVEVTQYNWFCRKGKNTNYASRHKPGTRGGQIHMHCALVDCPDSLDRDHKDRNGLNNTRDNIRIANDSQNAANTRRTNQTGFRGTYLGKQPKTWYAQCRIGGKLTHLGTFSSLDAAAKAYDTAALKEYGEFATLNFPMDAPVLGMVN